MATPLRVALFSDSFHELNGVGTVSREFARFAERRNIPLCCVHSGPKTQVTQSGSVTTLNLKRGFAFALDKDLYCDPFLSRYRNWVLEHVGAFRPDMIHITGPGDMGILGFWISNLLGVPMAASWHTNLHEYAGRRMQKNLRWLPKGMRESAAAATEKQSLRALVAFYKLAHFLFAPNQDSVDLLKMHTNRPAYRMKHGVDTDRFSPRPRNGRQDFCIGWVGRLTPEKNVRAFADLECQLRARGAQNFSMLLVGDGSEREWLRSRIPSAKLPGFLQGDDLAAAFASMDAFVFPSRTDTFGLVILEAMASGIPVILSPEAGVHVGIRDGVEGFLSNNFAEDLLRLIHCEEQREKMRQACATFAGAQTWDGVFEDLYDKYELALEQPEVRRRMKKVPALVTA